LIEAAIMFSASSETTWKFISKTDDQPKYIDQCKAIKVIKKSPGKSFEVHTVGNWMATYTYGIIENYLPETLCIYWTLDTSYIENDLIALNGYWQFYPYGKGQTLGRYGSSISLKNVPGFIANRFKKSGVKDALASVKKYVDSGGTYHK
jgi:ribosome-associated toxin RatA of RatAB toxin-antitoxin module